LEEAEEDDFEELGSFDEESITASSEGTSNELFTPTLKLELAAEISNTEESKELSTGISNTEESSTRFGDGSGFDLDNSTFSINPDTQLAPFSLDAGFNPNRDLSALTTGSIDWSAIQQTVSDFTQGYMEFAGGLKDGYLNSIVLGYDPHYVPTDSRFYNAGRVAGDVVSGLQGIGEIIGGGGIDGLGASACSTGGGCVLTGPALVAGNDLIAHGILVTASGGFNLGKDLTNFFAQENEGTGSAGNSDSSGSGKNSQFDQEIQNKLSSSNPGSVLEGEVANHVKNGGFDIVAFDKKIGPNGSIGQIDIETTNAIIEATIAPNQKLSQIKGLISNPNLNPSGKSVILYAPNYRGTPEKDITSGGGYVVRTPQELFNLLKNLGD
jgi:hypothetical protein